MIVILIITNNFVIVAQNKDKFNSDFINEYISNLEYDNVEFTNLNIDELYNLIYKPININKAKKRDLDNLFFLSEFQKESLQDYIKSTGAILSFSELSLVNGFNEKLVLFLSNFIPMGEKAYNERVKYDFYYKFSILQQ